MFTSDIALGGHGDMSRFYTQQNPDCHRKMDTAINILGTGGLIHQAYQGNQGQSGYSDYNFKYFADRGLGTVYHFEWAYNDGDGLSVSDKANIVLALNAFADNYSHYSMTDVLLGREDEDDLLETGAASLYLTDLEWFQGQVATILPGMRVWGPSVATRSNENGYSALEAIFDVGSFPSGITGVDIHAFNMTSMLPGGGNKHQFHKCMELVQDNDLAISAWEFCGCGWGEVTHWGEDYTIPEYTQAFKLVNNTIQALGYGASKIFHSHFPYDYTYDYSTISSIHNHNGLCVGPRVAGECWNASGSWRLAAYWYRFLCDMLRKFSLTVPGTVEDSGHNLSQLLSFSGSFGGNNITLYVCYVTSESREITDITITLGDSKVYYLGDIEESSWTRTVGSSSTITLSPVWIPQFVAVVN